MLRNVLALRRRDVVCFLLAAVTILLMPEWARSAEPPSYYNKVMPGNYTSYTCLRLKRDAAGNEVTAEMRAFNGNDMLYRFNDPRFENGSPCAWGYVRISNFESLQIGGQKMLFQRGGSGSTINSAAPEFRHGHIAAADVDGYPNPKPSNTPPENGAPCTTATTTLYYNMPSAIPFEFKYKVKDSNTPDNTLATWKNYGDKGGYNYMLWNYLWSDNTGGGQARATIQKDEPIRLCDVGEVVADAYDTNNNVIGYVIGRYGRVRNADNTVVYGWFIERWRYASQFGWNWVVRT